MIYVKDEDMLEDESRKDVGFDVGWYIVSTDEKWILLLITWNNLLSSYLYNKYKTSSMNSGATKVICMGNIE